MTKKIILNVLLFLLTGICQAQEKRPFRANLYNKEYDVLLHINFYDNDIKIPQQPIFGEMPGYLEYEKDTRVWIIVSAELTAENKAKLEIANDYGSEDLEATLTVDKNGEYKLKQGNGSRIKISVDRKWVKLPNELKFIKVE